LPLKIWQDMGRQGRVHAKARRQRLDAIEQTLLRRDAVRIWGGDYPAGQSMAGCLAEAALAAICLNGSKEVPRGVSKTLLDKKRCGDRCSPGNDLRHTRWFKVQLSSARIRPLETDAQPNSLRIVARWLRRSDIAPAS
jgi:hypothetical protein